LAFGVAVSAVAPARADQLPWQEAARHVGEERIVEGTVTAVAREGNVVRFRFDADPRSFTVAVLGTLLSPLPADLERSYVGRTIRAEGKIRSFHGVPELFVRDLTHITLIGAEGAPTPMVSGSDELSERVRRLEERVKRLEQQLAPGP
jgi:hypothetical protein